MPTPSSAPSGSSVGTAVIAALISSHSELFTTSAGTFALPSGDTFTIGFWACAGAGALAIVAALAAPGVRKRHEDAVAAGVDDVDDLVAH